MIIDEIRLEEDSKRMKKTVQQFQQGQWTCWESAFQRSLAWNEIWHRAPLRISFLIRDLYDLLPSNANLVRRGMKDDPTYPLCRGKKTTEHALITCKVALRQDRNTWRHNRLLQGLVKAKCVAKGLPVRSKARALVFTPEGGSIVGMNTQRTSLLDG
ncbi:reverse transcriptase [Plakobranchus ocellatus]|uniref:Reverse transcriptase n=1 Tax=Plakobranchus ocellatus TaxID=259542 RepID=A0AAV3YL06_9GAST|nr:reverse transcriptase [Plakobranchus ocellatus]